MMMTIPNIIDPAAKLAVESSLIAKIETPRKTPTPKTIFMTLKILPCIYGVTS